MGKLIDILDQIIANGVSMTSFALRHNESFIGSGEGDLHETVSRPGKNGKPPKDILKRTARGTYAVTTERVVFQGENRHVEWDISQLAKRPNLKYRRSTIQLSVHGQAKPTALGVDRKSMFPVSLELALALLDSGLEVSRADYQRMRDEHSSLEPHLGVKVGDASKALPPAVAAYTKPDKVLIGGCLGTVAVLTAVVMGANSAHSDAGNQDNAPAPAAKQTTSAVSSDTRPSAAPPSRTPARPTASTTTPTPITTPTPTGSVPRRTQQTESATPTASSLPVTIHTTTTTPPTPPDSTLPAQVTEPVHPGAFCSIDGATGHTVDGVKMVCTTTATDSRDRWRRA